VSSEPKGGFVSSSAPPAGTRPMIGRVAPLLPRQALRCLRYISAHRYASSTDVQAGVGIRHPSQVSGVLVRLERDGLVHTERGRRMLNAWEITERGAKVLAQMPEGLYE
jgi:DNA-binding PadR family transcriptional regulator